MKRILIAFSLLMVRGSIAYGQANTNLPTPIRIGLVVSNGTWELVGPTNLTVDTLTSAWGLVRTNTSMYLKADGSIPATGDIDLAGNNVIGAGGLLVGVSNVATLVGGQTDGHLTIAAQAAGIMLRDTTSQGGSTPGLSLEKYGKIFSLEHNIDDANRYLDVWYTPDAGTNWSELLRIDATRGLINCLSQPVTGVTASAFGPAWNGSSGVPNMDRVYDEIVSQSNIAATARGVISTGDVSLARLPTGTTNYVLTANGAGLPPS